MINKIWLSMHPVKICRDKIIPPYVLHFSGYEMLHRLVWKAYTIRV